MPQVVIETNLNPYSREIEDWHSCTVWDVSPVMRALQGHVEGMDMDEVARLCSNYRLKEGE